MEEYFKLLRQVLKQDRKKGEGVYYEAHHIIPKSFGKASSTVLLTPEEHYLAHKYLAEHFKNHSVYGKKMLWAFHRLAYDKGRKLTKEQYGEARRLLQPLWKSEKTAEHKESISKARRGKKTIVNPVTNEIKYVLEANLSKWEELGWENTNYSKGKSFTKKHKEKIGRSTKKRLTGKRGLAAQASKGPYTVEYEDGTKITKGSYPELVKATGIKYSTLQHRHKKGTNMFLKGWKIY